MGRGASRCEDKLADRLEGAAMRFRWLSEIGDNYMAEEGTHGHRFETIQGIPMAVWFKVTSRLKEAIVSLRNAKAVQKTARPGGSVKDLIRFHSTQQTRSAGIAGG
jgi:hypothetical protein